MPASFNISLRFRKKSAGAISGEYSGQRITFTASPTFEVLNAAAGTCESSFYRNRYWVDNPDLFGVKIARDLTIAFLKHLLFSVSPPNFLNCVGDRNHNVGGPFCNF
jgi:hypothetical protein